MSTALRLAIQDYERMIARGAFDGLGKRVELIHGELLEMNPAGPVHDDHVSYLTRWSASNTSANDCSVRIQSGLRIPEFDSQPEPDVLWVKPRRYLDRHPQANDVLLAIEVADSSLEYDRNTKAKLYGQAGICEYWIVDIQQHLVHVYQQPSQNGFESYQAAGVGDTVSPRAFPQARLDLSELFAIES